LHALTIATSPNANTHVQRTRSKANLHNAAAGAEHTCVAAYCQVRWQCSFYCS
jgi:hypothetical protein